MSERDDELITLLRGELERRATTPREGFDMRMQNSVRALERPRHTHRALAGGLAVAAVAVFALALAVGLRSHQNRAFTPPAAQQTPPVGVSGDLHVLQVDSNQGAVALRFVRGDGTVVRTVAIPGAPASGVSVLTTRGSQVFYQRDDDHLFSIGVDGVVHDHGAVTASGVPVHPLVISPDGRQWAWAETDAAGPSGNPSLIHLRVLVAGDGQPARVVYSDTRQAQPNVSTFDSVAAWTDRGIVVVRQPVGIGGFIPFEIGRVPRVVDVRKGVAVPLAGCDTYNDMLSGGGYVCADGSSPSADSGNGRVTVFDARGTVRRTITVAAPAAGSGNAMLSADGSRVAVEVETGGCPDAACRWRTDVVDLASDRVTHPAPADYIPLGWLPDGSLVAGGGFGTDAAKTPVLVVAADGHITSLGTGEWIGVVHR